MSDKQIMDVQDLCTVWAWIRVYGGTLSDTLITLNKRESRRHTEPFRGETYLHDAAEWIRAQLPQQQTVTP